MNEWVCPQAVETVSLENLLYLEEHQDWGYIIVIL